MEVDLRVVEGPFNHDSGVAARLAPFSLVDRQFKDKGDGGIRKNS